MSLLRLAQPAARAEPPRSPHLESLGAAPDEAARVTADRGEGAVQSAIATLTTYIPTETITLYVATLAALPALAGQLDLGGDLGRPLYWGFGLVVTPLVFALVLLAFQRTAPPEQRLPRKTVVFRFVAAPLAFLAWALSLPQAPYFWEATEGSLLGGLLALFVSTVFSLVERAFGLGPPA